MQDHMVPFEKDGKKYVKNEMTGEVKEVADIKLPSFNEMASLRAYPNGIRPKNFKIGQARRPGKMSKEAKALPTPRRES
jgi:hypothetical protein